MKVYANLKLPEFIKSIKNNAEPFENGVNLSLA